MVPARLLDLDAMRPAYRCLFVLLALGLCADATAQIYTCRGSDGSRVFSDERCGNDAKVVPGVNKSIKPAAKPKAKAATKTQSKSLTASATPTAATGTKGAGPKVPSAPKPAPVLKSAAELDELLKQCDAGKVAACNDWTRSGGPNRLREKERTTQLACDSGSLTACEERYCSDGASEQCRAKVLDAAKMAGQTWYLRDADRKLSDGSTSYIVRCIREGERTTQDVTVICAPTQGPLRCSDSGPDRAFPKLDAAASKYCQR